MFSCILEDFEAVFHPTAASVHLRQIYMSHEALSMKITQLISLAHLFGQDVREDSSIVYNISPDFLLSFE